MRLPTLVPLFAAISMSSFAGCSSMPVVSPQAVGPGPDGNPASATAGSLEVFTATQPVVVDDNARFNVHTGYFVKDMSGHTVKFVANHASNMDESPDTVDLAPGRYQIVAQSAAYGEITVPVVMEAGKTTVVHLDGSGRGGADDRALVHLPDGETIGWAVSEK